MQNHPGHQLFFGDNLDVLRQHIATASVDLVYLDPPFNSNATYNILFKSPAGTRADAQIEAFRDTWHWNDRAERAFDDVARSGHIKAFDLLAAMRGFLGENDIMAYLAMMAVRLIELHRVLKPTGALYLHCDPTASHYLKLLLDGIFGARRYLNEIVWKRTSGHGGANRWGPAHDTLLYFARSEQHVWNPQYQAHDAGHLASKYATHDGRGRFTAADLTGAGQRTGSSGLPWRGFDPDRLGRHWAVPRAPEAPAGWDGLSSQDKLDRLDAAKLVHWPTRAGSFPRFKRYLTEGVPLQSVVTDVPPVNSQAQERLGYPTQKPVALLERLIAASSPDDGVVLDPFCGCGTAVHAAEKLGRRWIGIDVTHLAISLIEKRMRAAFPGIAFAVEGTPRDLASARDLAARDKYQFQWWVVSMVDAMPFGGRRKGADGGIDGIIYFKPEGRRTEKALVSVKGGAHIGVPMVRDLHSAMEREKAPMGVFLSLAEPSKPMLKEAAAVGVLRSEQTGRSYPRLQIVTVAELLAGRRPDIPWVDPSAAFKRPEREAAGQARLL